MPFVVAVELKKVVVVREINRDASTVVKKPNFDFDSYLVLQQQEPHWYEEAAGRKSDCLNQSLIWMHLPRV